MYERSYGPKYNDLGEGWVDVAVIAKAVRADIKAAVKVGDIPKAKYSVRLSRFSGGQSIDVTISDLPFKARETRAHPYGGTGQFLTAEADAVHGKVDAILNAYNHDGSDAMTDYFDVRYYGHTVVDAPYDAEVAA